MLHDLLVFIGVLVLWWAINSSNRHDIKTLKARVRSLEIQCNTVEMNLKRHDYFRQIEFHELDPALTEGDRSAYADELHGELAQLADRNRFLLSQKD